MVRKKK